MELEHHWTQVPKWQFIVLEKSHVGSREVRASISYIGIGNARACVHKSSNMSSEGMVDTHSVN